MFHMIYMNQNNMNKRSMDLAVLHRFFFFPLEKSIFLIQKKLVILVFEKSFLQELPQYSAIWSPYWFSFSLAATTYFLLAPGLSHLRTTNRNFLKINLRQNEQKIGMLAVKSL